MLIVVQLKDTTKLYYSGSLGGKSMLDKVIDIVECRLLSCHEAYLNTARKWLQMACDHEKAPEREIMLDSGAFSAWSKGSEVDLDDLLSIYSEMVEKYADKFRYMWLINLDKIPGERGRSGTKEEIAEAIKISDRNFEILSKEFPGMVIPVFHQDESNARLREVCQQSKYICLSPRNDVKEKERRNWAQQKHQLVPPEKWTHGLATTGEFMMKEAPWRSVDSATWTQVAGYGKIMVYNEGEFFMNNTSEHSSYRRKYYEHTDHLPALDRQTLLERLDECGVTYDQCRVSYDVRAYVNIYFFEKFLRETKREPTSIHQETLDNAWQEMGL
jgi:hypothetical protein